MAVASTSWYRDTEAMIYSYGERQLLADGDYYVAPSADVIGSVHLGHEAASGSARYCAATTTGSTSAPAAMCRTAASSMSIRACRWWWGSLVTIGHGVLLHGCTIGDGSLIGNRATVLDGASVGAGSLIGAGCLVTPRMQIPPGSVVMGAPGKIVRQVEPRDLEWMVKGNESYRVKSRDYAARLKPA